MLKAEHGCARRIRGNRLRKVVNSRSAGTRLWDPELTRVFEHAREPAVSMLVGVWVVVRTRPSRR
jgi:hypothetical protein